MSSSSGPPNAASGSGVLLSVETHFTHLSSDAEADISTRRHTAQRGNLKRCDGCRSRRGKCDGDEPTCNQCRASNIDCAYAIHERMSVVKCLNCRSRRTQCDGVRPTCGNCSRLKRECTYHGQRKRNHDRSEGESSQDHFGHGPVYPQPPPSTRMDTSSFFPRSPRGSLSEYSPPPIPANISDGSLTPPLAVPDEPPARNSYSSVVNPFSSLPTILPKNEYTYLKISSDEVRLLLLSKGQPGDLIYCSLKTMNISRLAGAQLAYQALSYSWGHETASEEIFLRDISVDISFNSPDVQEVLRMAGTQAVPRRFYIRPNLAAALRRLRSETTNLWFWIDAICVNQDDDVEKTNQLPKMLDVYCNAWNVCIWIGDSAEAEEDRGAGNEAMDFIPNIVNLKILDDMMAAEALDECSASLWVSFADLLRRTWFRRRWVIQEVASSRHATVQCGGKSINWIDFADAVELFMAKLGRIRHMYGHTELSKQSPDALRDVESGGASAIVSISNNLLRKTENGVVLDRLWDIESLVTTFIHFEVSDPRDAIYALLPLASDSHPTPLRPPQRATAPSIIAPDYHKSQMQVFVEFVQHCVSSTGSLDIICRHWAPPPYSVILPTWVGRVADSTFGPPSKLAGRVNGDSFVGEVGRRVYNAHRGRPTIVRFIKPIRSPFSERSSTDSLIGRWTLHARGIRIGQITRASSRVVDGALSDDCLKLAGWNPNQYVNNISDRLWKTLVADRTGDGKNTPFWYRRACIYCLMKTTADGDLNTTKLLANKSLPETVLDYLKRVQAVVWNRKFFTMEGPGPSVEPLFGLGSRHIQQGDTICILFGCSVPVVVRPMGGGLRECEFIGECYVHGMMDGEAVAQLDSWSSPFSEQDFFIG